MSKQNKETQRTNCDMGAVGVSTCPFKIGEIAVFKSSFRFETYISRVMPIHVQYWGELWLPEITKATTKQKQLWYLNGKDELVIDAWY